MKQVSGYSQYRMLLRKCWSFLASKFKLIQRLRHVITKGHIKHTTKGYFLWLLFPFSKLKKKEQ